VPGDAVIGALLAVALAHTLDDATARVTLRDDHVDVTVELDLLLLAQADATALATGPDDALSTELDHLRASLETGVQLTVDGAPRPLRVRALPTPPELRAMAATASAAGESHGARVRVALDASDAVPGASELRLTMPPVLGPVLISFVQPASAYTAPGGSASFRVLGAPSAWPAVGALVFGLCAGFVVSRSVA